MPALRQVLLGGAVALFSTIIIIGALTLAFTERDQSRALALLPTAVISTSISLADLQQEWPTKTTTSRPTPTITNTPSPTAVICHRPAGMERISVLSGDTLAVLALRYDVSAQQLLAWNCIGFADFTVGTYLWVPVLSSTSTSTITATEVEAPTPEPEDTSCASPSSWITYTVKRGDNLYQIGQLYRIPWQELQRANCLSTTIIRVGQVLYVPNVPPSTSPPPTDTAAPLPPTRAVSIVPSTSDALSLSPRAYAMPAVAEFDLSC